MPLKWIPRSKSGASKLSRPCWAAHARRGNVWEYPLPGGGGVSYPV